MKSTVNTSIFAWIIAALLLCFVVTNFVPYYTYVDDEETVSVSLAAYLAFPSNYKAVDTQIKEQVEDYTINDIVGTSVLLLVAAVVLLVLICIYRSKIVLMILSVAFGIWGLIGYLTNPALQLGSNIRIVYLVIFALIAVLGAVASWLVIKNKRASEA